jgi:hypothetical protein
MIHWQLKLPMMEQSRLSTAWMHIRGAAPADMLLHPFLLLSRAGTCSLVWAPSCPALLGWQQN